MFIVLFPLFKNILVLFILTSVISFTSIAKEGSDINGSFIEAVTRGDVQAVQDLLHQGADVDAQDPFGHFTALMIAIDHSHQEIFHILIGAEADVNFQTKSGITPLMVASKDGIPGRDAIVNGLLASGADLSVLNADGDTAHDIAINSHVRNVTTFAKIDPEQLPDTTILRDWPVQAVIIYLLTVEKNRITHLNNITKRTN